MKSLEKIGDNYYVGLISINDLREVRNIPLDPNPRSQKVHGNIYKKIVSSLEEPNLKTRFEWLNRGITIACLKITKIAEELYEVEFRKKDNEDSTVDEKYMDGIIDGGHTYAAIKDISNKYCNFDKYVKIDFLTNLDAEDVGKCSQSRNTSEQVTDLTILDNTGKLDFLKRILKKQNYYPYIVWKQNNKKKQIANLKDDGKICHTQLFVDSDILFQLLNIFNIDFYDKNESTQPVASYANKKICIDRFINALNEKPNTNIFQMMSTIVPNIIELYQIINDDFKNLSSQKPINKRFTNKKGLKQRGNAISLKNISFKTIKDKKGNDKPEALQISNAMTFPVLNIFRSFVSKDERGNLALDLKECKEYWNSQKINIIRDMWRIFESDWKSLPNPMGKSQTCWENIYIKYKNPKLNL